MFIGDHNMYLNVHFISKFSWYYTIFGGYGGCGCTYLISLLYLVHLHGGVLKGLEVWKL